MYLIRYYFTDGIVKALVSPVIPRTYPAEVLMYIDEYPSDAGAIDGMRRVYAEAYGLEMAPYMGAPEPKRPIGVWETDAAGNPHAYTKGRTA